MTYRCLGNNNFEITLEFRRDCLNGAPGAQFDDPASIGIFDADGNLLTSLGNSGQLLIPFSSTDTLNEVLTTECSMVASDICVHRTTYRTTVNLPDRQGGYILAYQRCCRNFTLNNIVAPLETGSTYWIHITDNAMEVCNQSPRFIQWPDIFICQDDTLRFDHSAIDADGDSLVYELCVPSLGANQDDPRPQPPYNPPYNTVTWSAGYSLEDMMGGDPLTIDPVTGEIYAVPNTTGQFLIGICVKEYRDGQLLSEVRRDFEYNVRECEDSPMALFEPSHTIRCDRMDIAFNNMSNSVLTPFDELDFTWYFDYPLNTLKSIQANPNIVFPEPGLYTVALIVDDGTCLDTAFAEIGVSLPGDPTADFLLNSTICEDITEIQLSSTSTGVQEIIDYNWTVNANGQDISLSGSNPILEIGTDQSVEVNLQVTGISGCTDTISQIIDVQTPIAVDSVDIGPDRAVCEGETVILQALGNFESYEWSTGSTDRSIQVDQNGTYTVVATDSCGYSSTDTMILTVHPVETTSLSYEFCTDESIEVNGQVYELPGNYTQILTSQFGCDSILEIEVIIHLPQTREESYAFCLRHGIIVQGVLYDTIGQFQQTYIDEFGCEGTLILNLEAESDCDYCGSTLEISRLQITVNKYDTDMYKLSIKMKDALLFQTDVSSADLIPLINEFAIKKELALRAPQKIYDSYTMLERKNLMSVSDFDDEKQILNYTESLHIHDVSIDMQNIGFTKRYIQQAIEALRVGNSFSFR